MVCMPSFSIIVLLENPGNSKEEKNPPKLVNIREKIRQAGKLRQLGNPPK